MIGALLGSFGASLGRILGGGIISTIARYGGKMLGNYLEREWLHKSIDEHKYTNIRDSFVINTAKYGSSIPLCFGRVKVPAQIIWAGEIVEKTNTSTTRKMFKTQNLTVNKSTTELEYYLSFAVAICEGEITGIGNVWCQGTEINLGAYKYRLYKGTKDQEPDPLIYEFEEGLAPAYRDLAYIVFEELPLGDFNDTIPNFEFEVINRPSHIDPDRLEDILQNIVMIPGSGEYVYDTIVQEKRIMGQFSTPICTEIINSHNHKNIANSLYSLDQLQEICPNIKWIAPVVSWFGTSLNAQDCRILPAVEQNDTDSHYSEEWKVADYKRSNAHLISRDDIGDPNYGGTVNDTSILRYLDELKKRNIKTLFYPMFFLDIPEKPWRGRVTGDKIGIKNFFNREDGGYRDFILHYARLVKGKVDCFIIGSEMIGLTKIRDINEFPAVQELIKLAKDVKNILGSGVKITYSADWSEYHHTDGGWFNLDELWASDSIDFIGIDAYFPVTDTISSSIKEEDIKNGMHSGEGYDYYFDENGDQKKLNPSYAWKNLRYFWENKHVNPDGKTTKWIPKSKPIWFTEFGFPSIDKATNQPNIFFDPKSSEGGLPKHSSGNVDINIQRQAIRAFIQYWQKEEYIGNMFLWTWDARPSPAWPHMDVWRDGYLWEKGHWVNDKLGICSLSSLIKEICDRCEIDSKNIECNNLDQLVNGLVLSNPTSGIEAINMLRVCYFFDICANEKDLISFEKRGYKFPCELSSGDLVKISKNSFCEILDIPQENIINKLDMYYINPENDYNPAYIHINSESNSNKASMQLRLSLVMRYDNAENLGNLILKNAYNEKRLVKFIIPIMSKRFMPSDFVRINFHSEDFVIRVIKTTMSKNLLHVIGIVDDQKSYFYNIAKTQKKEFGFTKKAPDILAVFNLPYHPSNYTKDSIYLYYTGTSKSHLFSKLEAETDDQWQRIAELKRGAPCGILLEYKQSDEISIFSRDNTSCFIIKAYNFDKYLSKNRSRYLVVGNEIMICTQIKKIGENLYKCSSLIRGYFSTEDYIYSHKKLENCALMEFGASNLEIDKRLNNQKINFKIDGNSCDIEYKKISSLKPYIYKNKIEDNIWQIKWVERSGENESWQFSELENTGKVEKYKLIITDRKQKIEQIVQGNEKIIKISELAISDNFKVDIEPP